MKSRWFSLSVVVFVLAGAACLTSCGGKKEAPAARPARSLLKVMPKNTFMYIGFRDWKVLRDQTGAFDFLKTARRLKVGSRIKKLFQQQKEVTPEIRAAAERLEEIRAEISLWDLLGGEVALAGFTDEDGRYPCLALLIRLPGGKEKIYEDYLSELAGMAGEKRGWEFKESAYLDEKITTVTVPEAKIDSRPSWCRLGGMMIISSREEGIRELIARMKGRDDSPGLLDSPLFQRVFSGLDPAARGVTYIHPPAFTAWARKLYRIHKNKLDDKLQAEKKTQAVESRQVVYYLKGLVKLTETIEVITGNFGLSDEGYWEKNRIYLDPEKGSKNLVALLQRPPKDWDLLDYIPAGTAGAGTGYLNFGFLYRSLLDYLSRDPVRGKVLVERWRGLQDKLGFHPDRDLLSWIGDEYAAVTLSAPTSMMDPGSFAYLLKVTSEEKMERAIDRLFSLLEKQSVTIVEEEYRGSKMRIVYLPLPMFPLTPTLGKVGDCLVLAGRKEDFRQIVDVYKKDKPSIRSEKDFQEMRRRIGRAGTDFTFTRLEERTDSLVTLIRSSSSMVGMMAASKAETESARPEEIVSLMNDIALVLEDLKVFKLMGMTSRWQGEYLEVSKFIEIGKKKQGGGDVPITRPAYR